MLALIFTKNNHHQIRILVLNRNLKGLDNGRNFSVNLILIKLTKIYPPIDKNKLVEKS